MTSTVPADTWAIVLPNLLMSASSLFFNGICIMLAVQACYFLMRRAFPGRNILICTTIAACALGIVQMIHQVVFTAKFLRMLQSAEAGKTFAQEDILASIQHLQQVKDVWDIILLIVNNTAADSLFIYRCCMIWGRSSHRRWVVGVPVFLLLFTTAFGTATISTTFTPTRKASSPMSVFYHQGDAVVVILGAVIATNTLLTGLSAGRIWWTRHHLRVIGETTLVHRCNTAIAMLLESSALYLIIVFTFLLSQIIGGSTVFDSPAISVLRGASLQLMNIIPPLIIVRASLARCVDTDPTAGRLGLKAVASI
ncbi:hypothetical protein DFH06DRAFT_742864 [Mycena polygramma]|nr:hypothetical protein DFH06DRAFT_742864 [Mycena polygramma]